MAIKQKPNNWPKETEVLQTKRVKSRALKNDLLVALTWKKEVRQRPDNWPKQAEEIKVSEWWKKEVKQRPNNWPKQTEEI